LVGPQNPITHLQCTKPTNFSWAFGSDRLNGPCLRAAYLAVVWAEPFRLELCVPHVYTVMFYRLSALGLALSEQEKAIKNYCNHATTASICRNTSEAERISIKVPANAKCTELQVQAYRTCSKAGKNYPRFNHFDTLAAL
jgi:hypothetical protein